MNQSRANVDCIYLAASSLDGRFTRICVASIRFFYPEVPIRLLVGGPLLNGLSEELQRYWGVEIADLPLGDYGWGFVKLEPLFGLPGERFLVVDSDTIMVGPVLDHWKDPQSMFLVDDESQSQEDVARLYYDWKTVRSIDGEARAPMFTFNSGQWFGTSGVLTREEFSPLIEWTMPRKLRHPNCFMPGDQGVLNYVLNKHAIADSVVVERCKIMIWPGHGLSNVSGEKIKQRTAPPCVVHWAGMKRTFIRKMVGAELLMFFEKYYYERIPGGRSRRFLANCQHVWLQWKHAMLLRARLAYQKRIAGRIRKKAASQRPVKESLTT